jgi:hypothetical protein
LVLIFECFIQLLIGIGVGFFAVAGGRFLLLIIAVWLRLCKVLEANLLFETLRRDAFGGANFGAQILQVIP